MLENFHKYAKFLMLIFFVLLMILIFSDFEYSGDRWLAIVTSFSSVVSILGLVFVSNQLIEMRKQSSLQSDQMKQELEIVKLSKSLEKANEFREILDDCSLFTAVIQTDKKYIKLIESKNLLDFEHFRFSELKSNFPSEDDRKFLMDMNELIINNFKHVATIYQYSKLCNQGMDEEILKYSRYDWDIKEIADKKYNINLSDLKTDYEELITEKREALTKKEDSTEVDGKALLERLNAIQKRLDKFKNFNEDRKAMEILEIKITYNIKDAISELLNRLETWAMAFNIGLADEDIVYQSIHQAYLETVKYFYPTICRHNDNEIEDQYYTNIRDLYVRWSQKNTSEKKNGELDATMKNKSKQKLS